MTKVKICGLKTLEDIQMMNRLKPDYVGFVFAKSKRQISMEQAANLREALLKDIKSIGVFVNAEPEIPARAAQEGVIQVIQLHGDEDRDYIETLRSLTDKTIIKAVRVRDREDILRAQKLSCHYLLLDTYTKAAYGGSGKTFDWSCIPDMEKPYFLAGGLTTENVGEAVRKFHPYGVDVSSAVETEGKKDENKVRLFIEQVRKQRG